MNRLLYGIPNPKELVADMIEVQRECECCNGIGGFYYDAEVNKISREEYLKHKGYKGYEMVPCEICEGQGIITEYEEVPDYWAD